MFEFSNPETMWLNITNLGLGIVTFAAVIGVGVVAVREIAARFKTAASTAEHTLVHPDLGLTMADGGEPIEKKATKAK